MVVPDNHCPTPIIRNPHYHEESPTQTLPVSQDSWARRRATGRQSPGLPEKPSLGVPLSPNVPAPRPKPGKPKPYPKDPPWQGLDLPVGLADLESGILFCCPCLASFFQKARTAADAAGRENSKTPPPEHCTLSPARVPAGLPSPVPSKVRFAQVLPARADRPPGPASSRVSTATAPGAQGTGGVTRAFAALPPASAL